MVRRFDGMPAAAIITATSFVVFGGMLLFAAASAVMGRGSGDDMPIAFGVTTLAGVAFTAIGLGVAAGRPWARILGILGGTLVALAAAAGMLFVGLMAGGVGIGWDDRLFLEPFSFLLVFLVAAVGCVVALARSRAWFASRPWPEHTTSVPAFIAASVLFLVGLPLEPWGPVLIGEGLGHGTGSGGVREVLIIVGSVILVIGLLHVLAAILIWTHRDTGRSLGMVIGAIGTLVGAVVAVNGATNLTLLLMPVPHLVVLIGLLRGRSHFTRQE